LLVSIVALAVAGCGSRFAPPAATVDGRDISEDAVQSQLDLVLSNPQVAQQLTGPQADAAKADFTRQALATLIQQALAEEYADAHGIVVTSADVDKALQDTITQVGGQAEFDRVVRERRLSSAQVQQILRAQVLIQKVRDDVVANLPTPPASAQEGDAAFQRWLTDRMAHADVSVNPRFGHYDPRTGEVAQITSTADLG
jgi:FKBP-type peptidyl-prolyl cis-trans isomerase (trigger factor)